MKYAEALAAPKRSGKGWKHAGPESMLAAACESVAMLTATNAESLYDAARRKGIDHRAVVAMLPEPGAYPSAVMDLLFSEPAP